MGCGLITSLRTEYRELKQCGATFQHYDPLCGIPLMSWGRDRYLLELITGSQILPLPTPWQGAYSQTPNMAVDLS